MTAWATQKVGLKANAEKRKDISDTYWRTKSTYAEALSVVSEERSLLADMMNTERDELKHGVIRLRGIAMHYTQLPVTYNPGRAAPEVEAIYRLQEARRNSKNRELIAGLGAEVDAYGDLAFARAQGRLTVEHYLAALGQPDLREQYRQRKSAYEAQVAKFAPCSVNGRKIEELQDSCFSGFLRLRL